MIVRTEIEMVEFRDNLADLFRLLGYKVDDDGTIHFEPQPASGVTFTVHTEGPRPIRLEINQGRATFTLAKGDWLGKVGRTYFPIRRDDVAFHKSNLIHLDPPEEKPRGADR